MISMITKEQYKRLEEIRNELTEIENEIYKTYDSAENLTRAQILTAVLNISNILPPWDI